jgi:hypothetical protein
MRTLMPELPPRDRAEADLARELRALGMGRGRAMTVAEAKSARMTIDDVGGVAVTLSDGTVLYGETAIKALAAELLRGM